MKTTNELKTYYKEASIVLLEECLYLNKWDKEKDRASQNTNTQARLTLKIDLIENELKTRKGLKTFNFNFFGFNINFTKA